MATYKEAIAEVMASGDMESEIVETLEFRHPLIIGEDGEVTPIRVLLGETDMQFRLEADAPVNAGEMVLFQKAQFEITGSEMGENKEPKMVLSIGAVNGQIVGYLEVANTSPEPVDVTYRQFLYSEPESGPIIDPVWNMELSEVDVNEFVATGTIALTDMHNAPFPLTTYTPSRFKGLVR